MASNGTNGANGSNGAREELPDRYMTNNSGVDVIIDGVAVPHIVYVWYDVGFAREGVAGVALDPHLTINVRLTDSHDARDFMGGTSAYVSLFRRGASSGGPPKLRQGVMIVNPSWDGQPLHFMEYAYELDDNGTDHSLVIRDPGTYFYLLDIVTEAAHEYPRRSVVRLCTHDIEITDSNAASST